ncbi:GreA/GreB family elongation factor [Sphingomonas sp. LaA6.9]|uniref:GreA/GreB family elongation factor n=1 Tax=Sphingomonas sp. LaA6.9 TaxID=2919914 RepID=UPI001F4FA733|nr:GreA/GreB family elongation factor [Sphingomonas sp. LaA6.9]MCJ8156532.1 GreA/GreB family elongation factor [Sphingomonas sp. LaA6.9]
MSVAFRRDVDEEHLEPRPELPIPPGPNLVTPRGLALIEARVGALESTLAGTTVEEEIKAIERDLRYWRARRATAQVMPAFAGDTIRFGARVKYADDSGTEHNVDIVGADEADPAHGRIAFTAPLARALIGAGEGDLVDFGGKAEALEILAVIPIPD